MKTPRVALPKLRISRTPSTRDVFEISEPLKTVRKSPSNRLKKIFEPIQDAPTYFAFQVKEAWRLDKADPEKIKYFLKRLEVLKCERIIDDEIDLEKDSHIIILGPYSKLFELFSLIRYMNIFDVNCIKMQFLMKNQKGETLIILPLIRDELKTYESENSIMAKMFSPRGEREISESEAKLRKQLEEEEYQRKVEELESRHREFLKEHGLSQDTPKCAVVPRTPKSPTSMMKEVLNDIARGLNQRGERLEKLENDTELLEHNTADFAQKAHTLRVKKEMQAYGEVK